MGIGPGSSRHMTFAAAEALRQADVVIGYHAYVAQVRARLRGKHVIARDIGLELERAAEAIDLACQGHRVALISGGDAGIYGMAAPLFETLEARGWQPDRPPRVRVVPGVSAAQAAAAVLGAPLMHDFATISLSDLLISWEIIEQRVRAAARADFVLALYNPASQKRTTQLDLALRIVRASRSSETPVAFVHNAGRREETIEVTTLAQAHASRADMRTIVIVGSSSTRRLGDLLLTPRGYASPAKR
ncbi:MAG TPA: precorrin-3B C(17)-methyltransferase [Chloroflexota bacterium]|nr:precorrin-3B C(17)-methyltransferase [Chloroflexota bacterium]